MPMERTSTYLLHCFIAGLQYYDVLEIWKSLKIGDPVDFDYPTAGITPNAQGQVQTDGS